MEGSKRIAPFIMVAFYLGALVLTFWVLLTSAILGMVCRSASPRNQAFRYFSPGNTVEKSGWRDVITSVKVFLWELIFYFLLFFFSWWNSLMCQPSWTLFHMKCVIRSPVNDCMTILNYMFICCFPAHSKIPLSCRKASKRIHVSLYLRGKIYDLFSSKSSQAAARYRPKGVYINCRHFKPKVLVQITDVINVPVLTSGLMKNEGLAA